MTKTPPPLSPVARLRPPKPADDIPATLRRLADEIEGGRYGLLTTAVVVVGHTEERPGGPDITLTNERYHTFGMGPRCDAFTVRGLLMGAVIDPAGGEPGED